MTRRAIWLPLGLFAAAIVGLIGLSAQGAQAGGGATFSVTSATVAPNGSVTVDFVITPDAGFTVGAYSVDIVDDGLVSATGCTVSAIGTQVCNAAFAADTVRFGGAATGAGFSGNSGTITYLAGATEGVTTLTLNVDTAACTDVDTVPITCTGTNGTITITTATPVPPTPSPTPVPTTPAATTAAATAVPATATPTPAGLPPTGGDSSSSTLPLFLAAMGIATLTASAWAVTRLRRVQA